MNTRLTSAFAFLLAIGLAWALPTQAVGPDPVTAKGPTSPMKVVLEPEGNQMKFATTEFTVNPGEEVRLVFKNTANSPAMVHNVVMLTTSEDAVAREVGQAGASAGASANYAPNHDAILAATEVAKPGETVEVTFTAPENPGEYTYLCTYPGHWTTMQGTMRVEN